MIGLGMADFVFNSVKSVLLFLKINVEVFIWLWIYRARGSMQAGKYMSVPTKQINILISINSYF